YKKIGFAYYNKIQSEKDVDDENAIKSISYLNSSLLLNGANAEAAYYLASTYAMIGSDHKCIQALQHLKLIESSDSEGYLKMVKEEITFNKIRNNTLFIEFINAIDY
ncbi:MAG: hypothetical protein OEX22_12365, partial [Cyclobacteriaceae bacterium]|nr:hypothetical protein [Cyclobacteriaceae bacterium]